MLITLIISTILVTPPQQSSRQPFTPTPHYRAPSSALLEEHYFCFGKDIKLSATVSEGIISVSEYIRGDVAATPLELEEWNRKLEDIREFGYIRFSCASGGYQAISIHGAETPLTPHNKIILARWSPNGVTINDVSN